jgi:hypothetical protein
VQVGFVNDVQAGWVESLLQALPNGCRYRHAATGICHACPFNFRSRRSQVKSRVGYSRYATDTTDCPTALS